MAALLGREAEQIVKGQKRLVLYALHGRSRLFRTLSRDGVEQRAGKAVLKGLPYFERRLRCRCEFCL